MGRETFAPQRSVAPLSVSESAEIQFLVLVHGELRAADLLGVAAATLARAVAGFPVQRATRTHLMANLRTINAQPTQPTLSLIHGGDHGVR